MIRSLRDRRGRNRGAEAINLAPLIDMMFILLIFFMVTTTFVTDLGIEVERPRSSTASAVDARSLRVSVTDTGSVWVDGERIELDALRARVRRHTRESGDATVVVVPDASTPSEDLVRVLDAARLGGARALAIAARAPTGGGATR